MPLARIEPLPPKFFPIPLDLVDLHVCSSTRYPPTKLAGCLREI